jgi:L-2,4-diaminobutyrate decarboxylase
MVAIAREEGAWLHADAAYGGALILSPRHARLLDGIGEVDSLTVDFHKLFYQPISCGAFLVRDRERFDLFRLHADYLNPESNEDEGVLDLVAKSLQTTRRFDGLKLFMTLQVLGRETMAAMIDATLDVARAVAEWIASEPKLELVVRPALNAVVFRYRGDGAQEDARDSINAQIRRELLSSRRALIAQTRVNGDAFLKMTLLNPRTTPEDIISVLREAIAIGDRLTRARKTPAGALG